MHVELECTFVTFPSTLDRMSVYNLRNEAQSPIRASRCKINLPGSNFSPAWYLSFKVSKKLICSQNVTGQSGRVGLQSGPLGRSGPLTFPLYYREYCNKIPVRYLHSVVVYFDFGKKELKHRMHHETNYTDCRPYSPN